MSRLRRIPHLAIRAPAYACEGADYTLDQARSVEAGAFGVEDVGVGDRADTVEDALDHRPVGCDAVHHRRHGRIATDGDITHVEVPDVAGPQSGVRGVEQQRQIPVCLGVAARGDRLAALLETERSEPARGGRRHSRQSGACPVHDAPQSLAGEGRSAVFVDEQPLASELTPAGGGAAALSSHAVPDRLSQTPQRRDRTGRVIRACCNLDGAPGAARGGD